MTKKASKWGLISEQTAAIAGEASRQVKPKPAMVDETAPATEQTIPPVPEGAAEVDPVTAVEAVTAQPHEAAEPETHEAVEPKPHKSAKLAPVKRTSTSLYLSPAAHREIRLHAADKGLKSNQVYEAALKLYFKKHQLGDFDDINSRNS